MNRRQFTTLAATAAAALASSSSAQQPGKSSPTDADVDASMKSIMAPGAHKQIAMLLYPGMYPLDLVGPYTFLSGLMNADVYLVAKTLDPVGPAGKMRLLPTTTFADCPRDLDVLFVPGGMPGTIGAMQDSATLDFLADRGSRARFVTSVCTGSLILGAAGLLKGYRATSHWDTRDILPTLGAIPVNQRIVEDRNRITGGGVTSGIDFGLLLAQRLSDSTYARMLQLINEYDPQPPFQAGTPAQAGPVLTAHLTTLLAASHQAAAAAAESARQRLKLS
jgi:putative intracellular protease/amidase